MLRQIELAQFQHFRAVDDGVHEDVLIQSEPADVVPAEDLVLRQDVVVTDHFLVFHADFFVHIVGNDHIHFSFGFHKVFYGFKDLVKRFLIHPVVAVHDFKIFSGGMAQPPVHCVAVSAVFFADRFDNGGIFFLIAFGDGLGAVF